VIALAKAVAREAGMLIAEGRASMKVVHKGEVDLVTQLDQASESLIRERFEAAEPGIAILAEEEGGMKEPGTRWIVDPLDGTTNFVHGFPFYCVSIALERDGQLELGVVYDIPNNRMYAAERGRGATCDDQPIFVSKCDSLDRALVASGFAYDRRSRADFYLRYVKSFLEQAQGFRRCGSAAMDLAMLASGQLDAYWEFGLNPWDVAAGAVLVKEAGGQVSDMRGEALNLQVPEILASNSALHSQMIRQLAPLLEATK
jgi:myo-inositol-1(or 4)-monophosphatase